MSALRVAISTLGCRSNQYDSAALEDALREASLQVVPFPGPADAYVINTCTVTGSTDSSSRQAIRRARRDNPEAVIIVTGCYAQVAPKEAASIEGVDFVVGNPEKGRIVECVLKGRQESAIELTGNWRDGTPWSLRARSSSGRTRANFKLQEGCSRACAYCIIPRARGLSRSLPLGEVERELDLLVEAGYKEVVLTGIHLGAWGADLEPCLDITAVLEMIERKAYPCRFRLSSLDPDEVTDRLIELMKDARTICNHLHLPLQSGDDSVIARMKRPYTGAQFAGRVQRLAASIAGVSIGVDVIAGFPGEGQREFRNTEALLADLPVSYLHVFPFSRRQGTLAAGYPDQVDRRSIRQRCERLHRLDSDKRASFHTRFVGERAQVLVELARDRDTGLLKGRTGNYIQVFIDGHDRLKGALAQVRLGPAATSGMAGSVAGPITNGGIF